MIRFGTGILIATAAACAAFGVAACGDSSVGGGGPPVSATGGGGATGTGGSGTGATSTAGGSSNGGSAGATTVSDTCTGACCPTDASCYSTSAGATAPGAACMARIQNTADHMQMRQTWLDILTPAGNVIPLVLGTLNTYTQLPEAACNTPGGGTGYMQAVDLDLTTGISTLGYTKFTTTQTALSDGLCFVDIGMGADTSATSSAGWKDVSDIGSEKNFDFSLPASMMSPSGDYPPGLTPPMPQPWKVAPTKAKRVDTDFNVANDRKALLARLAPTGDLGMAGYTGVFYYDTTTGTSHGYSPVSYQIIYDAPATAGALPTTYIVVPIREAEITYRANDPKAPNCIGKYLPGNADPTTCAEVGMEATKPSWGGIYDTTPGEGDAHVQGYFLITELEQVYSKVLGQTLCVSYPTRQVSQDAGWATDTEARCRKAAAWNPSDAMKGLPKGDWCAASNSMASDACHDSYKSVSFHAFQAFKIKSDHCSPL
ncbi:MAG TPA: hypothetical protein VH062_15965 [Polyangiaceae bacterium]|jgi:hypothetical protein|nr:hypothetical protein [Polyangiaceae bacterium]